MCVIGKFSFLNAKKIHVQLQTNYLNCSFDFVFFCFQEKPMKQPTGDARISFDTSVKVGQLPV